MSGELASRELLRVVDVAGIGLLGIDRWGTVVVANEAAHQLLGRRAGSLVGLSAIAAFLDHRVEELLRTEGTPGGRAEMDLVIGGEPQRVLLLRVEPVGANDPARAGALLAGARDAGARDVAPSALLDGGAWLLIHDVSELRRLQRIRSEFIDNLAHELRTPLATIRLLAEVLSMESERTALPPRVVEAVAKIDVESGHLAQMVDELLDLSRIEQGEALLRRQPVDLAQVIDSVMGRLRAYADRQGVRLRAQPAAVRDEAAPAGDEAPPAHSLVVAGDAERLEQMLVNLVHNAVKFSAEGGEVVVRLSAGEQEVLIEVEDQGVGIPAPDLERIFERFYKVDRARTRAGQGGTGLGLAIARHIAERHRGRIWATSEEGRGSVFSVALPRRSAAPVGLAGEGLPEDEQPEAGDDEAAEDGRRAAQPMG